MSIVVDFVFSDNFGCFKFLWNERCKVFNSVDNCVEILIDFFV